MSYTLGSLFAGIGGIDLGFERAGFTTKWQVEIDPYCRKVLAKHFPHAERFEDVRNCGSANLSPVDVIVGGFPCQDISNAGTRAGISGQRSGLWGEMVRAIRLVRPKFAFVENVAALLGRGMGRVCGDLAEIGNDAEWDCVSARDIGAKHIRDRVWIVAYPSCLGYSGPTTSEASSFYPERDYKTHRSFRGAIANTAQPSRKDMANSYSAGCEELDAPSIATATGFYTGRIAEEWGESMGYPLGWTDLEHSETP
jgi:DNA-cytosine methyltransferase